MAIAQDFCAFFSLANHKNITGFDEGAGRALLEHSWPDYNNGSRQNQPEAARGLRVQTKIGAFVTE